MKFVALTIFALISTGLALPVQNLNDDVLIELINDKVTQESYFVSSINAEVDEESKKLAQFFVAAIPKLEKISQGLKNDGHEKASKLVARATDLYRPFVDEAVVAEQKTRAKFYAFAAIAIMHVNKKYLEESSEEALLEALDLAQLEDNQEVDLVSVFVADVDEESKQLAQFFEKTIPKLEKISQGLKKDGKEKASKILDKAIAYYKTLTSEKIAENKSRARVHAFVVIVIMHANKKYLEEEKTENFVEALNFVQLEDVEEEADLVSVFVDVDEESKQLAQFFTENIPNLEKIRDGLKKDGYEKASKILAKAIELYRPFTNAENVVANKSKAKFYAFVTIVVMHFNQRYLEQ